jgi:hypothetical protein
MGILPERPWANKLGYGTVIGRWNDTTYTAKKHEPKPMWIVVRYSNNKVWAGPWRGDGKLWTTAESKYGLFASEEEAEKSAEGEYPAFNFRWGVFEL